jgi:hypothetical protein
LPTQRPRPESTVTIQTHQTAPTQFVEAKGIRFAYRRFGNAAHASAASHPAHWAVATSVVLPDLFGD